MEQVVQLPMSFLYKVGTLLSLLIFGTAFMVTVNVLNVLKRGPSMSILFSNEYALTMVSLIGSAIRFTLNCIDILNPEESFDQRSTIIFYLDFFIDLFKLLIYSGFFAVVMAYYGLPIHIIRDLYVTVISFTKRVKDMINYHQIMSTLQTRYPDVSEEELTACNDRTCIICREEMVSAVKRLPCGHFFHFKCLKSWLERQQVCPTCRKSVLEVVKTKLEPQTQNNNNNTNGNNNSLADLQDQNEPLYPGNYRPNWSETNSVADGSVSSFRTPNSSTNTVNSRLLFSPFRRSNSTTSILPVLINDEETSEREENSTNFESERLKISAELERIGRRSRSPSNIEISVSGEEEVVSVLSPLSHVKSKIEYVEELMSEHEKILQKLRRVESEIISERSFSLSRSQSEEFKTDQFSDLEDEKGAPEA